MYSFGKTHHILSSHNVIELCLVLQLFLLGVIGQWLVKPALGMLLASTLVPALHLPSQVATGLMLVSMHLLVPLCKAAHTTACCQAS